MAFSRVNPAGWAMYEVLTSAQMNTLDIDHANAVDGLNGGTYNPTTSVTWNEQVIIDDSGHTRAGGSTALEVTPPLASSGGTNGIIVNAVASNVTGIYTTGSGGAPSILAIGSSTGTTSVIAIGTGAGTGEAHSYDGLFAKGALSQNGRGITTVGSGNESGIHAIGGGDSGSSAVYGIAGNASGYGIVGLGFGGNDSLATANTGVFGSGGSAGGHGGQFIGTGTSPGIEVTAQTNYNAVNAIATGTGIGLNITSINGSGINVGISGTGDGISVGGVNGIGIDIDITGSGDGVDSSSNSGRGVYGTSASNYGGEFVSTGTTGLRGVTSATGVAAHGVYGQSGANANSAAVYGYHTDSGHGIYGYCADGTGARGRSTDGTGVLAESTNGYAVRAIGDTTSALRATCNAQSAVYAIMEGTSGAYHGVYGQTDSDTVGAAGVTGYASGDGAGVRANSATGVPLHIVPGSEPTAGSYTTGSLYVTTGGVLMIYNGSAWVAVGSQT